MATTYTRFDDVSEADAQRLHLSDADRAAIERTLLEPGIALTADGSEAGAQRLLAELLAGLDDEVRALLAAGRVAEALGVARFNAFEAAHDWNEGRSYRPCDDPPTDLEE